MKNLNLSNIKDYFKNLKITTVLFIALVLLSGILYGLYYHKSEKLKLMENNLKAYSDTIKVLKNKAGENVYKINSLTLSYKELKEVNSGLVNEIDKLSKKDKKSLVEINKLNIKINLLNDSIKNLNNKPIGSTIDTITGLTTYNYELKDSTKFRELKGTIKVTSSIQPIKVNTILTSNVVYADLVIGKTLKNDKLELFVTSSNSGLSVTNIEGSVIDLKAYNNLQPKKKFSIGAQIGYGLTIYGATPYVGIGGSFNLINF